MYVYMRRECVQVAEREFAACPDGAVQGRFITYSKVLDFMHWPQLPSKKPRVLRLRGKHAYIQRKKRKRKITCIFTHIDRLFFFHRLKCETRHTFSSQVAFK